MWNVDVCVCAPVYIVVKENKPLRLRCSRFGYAGRIGDVFLFLLFIFHLPPLAPTLPFCVAYPSTYFTVRSVIVATTLWIYVHTAMHFHFTFAHFHHQYNSIVIDGIINAIVRLAVLLPPPKTTTSSFLRSFPPAFLHVLYFRWVVDCGCEWLSFLFHGVLCRRPNNLQK